MERIYFSLKSIFIFLMLLGCLNAIAQPINDNCENAIEIIIPNRAFDYGTFISSKCDVNAATRQRGEQCSKELEENGNCDKTVWYKFYIPTTRNISVQLTQQDSAIPQIFAGFNVYMVKNCNYSDGDLALNLTPLNKFGESGNTCLKQGWYYIQVGAKQRAAGEIWIELTSVAPFTQNYDQFTAPYDFGLLKDKSAGNTFSFTCASVTQPELAAIGDSSFNKSIFITFTMAANSAYSFADFYYTAQRKFKYRLFRDTLTADSVNSNKPFLWCNQNFRMTPLRAVCPPYSPVNQKYYLQIVVNSKDDPSAYLIANLFNTTNTADLWNTPNTNDIITTSNGFTRTLKHYFNCTGQLKYHSCKQVIPNEFYKVIKYYDGTEYIDTFNMAGYTVINVTESGTLSVVTRDPLMYVQNMRYAIYKGNISQGCNLTYMFEENASTFSVCVEPGTYTLLTLTQNDVYNQYINHIITQKATVLNTVHYYPNAPELMGNYKPSDRVIKYSSTINYNQSKDTVLTIDTLTLKGYFIYREFRLTETAPITINESNYGVSNIYLVKGRLSKGTASLLPDYIYYYNANSYYPNMCQKLDSGYYTIISRLDTSKKTRPCVAPFSSLSIGFIQTCSANNYTSPATPYKINNNNNALASAANFKNIDYVYQLPLCTDCNTNNSVLPALKHQSKRFTYEGSTKYSFTTFYLAQNAELRLPNQNYTNFELYTGDCSANQSVILDTNNIVSPCFGGNVYCNLDGGKYYTLVTYNGANVVAYFTPHYKPVNDFAVTAYDFGHFNSNTSRTSAPIPITCHINGFVNEPCSLEYNMKRCLRYALKENIPYKDTLNFKRAYGRKTLWYTLTADMAATFTLQVSANTTLYKNPKINVFRYKGPFVQNFATLAAAGFDSTDNTLEWVATNKGIVNSSNYNRDNFATFENFGCGPSRYFIILEDEYEYDKAHYEYKIKVTYQQTTMTNKGDFCSNAVADSLNTYGTKNLSVNNTCHTWGNSPYESNPDYAVKSSWFRIKVSSLKSCDIKIKCTAGDGLLYYNVYGGSCQIMTRVSRLADLYSYFTLSCMGPGNYYIQAVSKASVNAVISFEVNTLIPENPNCKPYDFRMPIAQYNIKGGCKNDTIRFQNMSSKGPGIAYAWYINNVLFSTAEEPTLLISNPLVLLNNNIKLRVKNTVDNISDSITKTYTKDTTNYSFKITGPAIIRCSDTAILKVNTNFPYKINYTWTDQYSGITVSTPERTAPYTYPTNMFYVTGKSDNCLFKDSFLLKVANYMDKYRDTSICAGQGFTIYAKSQDYFYINSASVSKQITDSLTLTQTGVYYLRYQYKWCTMYDTMNIELDTGHTTVYAFDSAFTCNNAYVTLKYKSKLRNYLWSNGKTTESIMTNLAGIYTLKGDISDCRDLEYKVTVKTNTAAIDPISGMVLCKGDTFVFKNKYSGFTVTSKTPAEDTIIIQKTFQARIFLKNGACIIADSAMIYMSKPAFRIKDTMFCSDENAFPVTLDAGVAKWYYWLHDQSTGRTADVYNYGIYKVATQSNTCTDTTTFTVRSDCSFKVYIPGVFTPNGDNINDGFGPLLYGPYKSFTITIFNRWGEILFKSDNSEPWNGWYKGAPVQQSVYGYMITIRDVKNSQFIYNGTVTVLR